MLTRHNNIGMGCAASIPKVKACKGIESMLERAPELRPIATKLELETALPMLEVDDVHTDFVRICPLGTGGLMSQTAFGKLLGIGDMTPFMVNIFRLFDLNESGEIDFNEFLYAAYNFCPLQDDENIFRCLFMMYREKKVVRWSKMHQMIQDVQGSLFSSKLWWVAKKHLAAECAQDTKCTWEEFVKVATLLKQLFLPAFSFRDELRDRFFGEELWWRAYRIRKKNKVMKYTQDDIDNTKIEMMGLTKVMEAAKKVSKVPVKHKTEAKKYESTKAWGNFRPGFSVSSWGRGEPCDDREALVRVSLGSDVSV